MARANTSAYLTEASYPTTWPSAANVLLESMNTVFDRHADEMPLERSRAIHAHGALASVRYVPSSGSSNLGLTGIYKTGCETAILRLSLAGQPSTTISPGFALKFLHDKTISSNIIGMYSLDGQAPNDWNFFRNQLKTRVAMPTSTSFFGTIGIDIGVAQFKTGATPVNQLDVDQPAFYNADGTISNTIPVAPKALYLVPNPTLTAQFATTPHEFRTDLTSIPISTLLYTVYGAMDPTGCDKCGSGLAEPCPDVFTVGTSCVVVEIGQIYSTSMFVSSPWVDNRVFFQHSRVDKKSRKTCLFSRSLDDDDEDSTVLPTEPDDTADCEISSCPYFTTKASKVGCPRDVWVAPIVSSDDNNNGTNSGSSSNNSTLQANGFTVNPNFNAAGNDAPTSANYQSGVAGFRVDGGMLVVVLMVVGGMMM